MRLPSWRFRNTETNDREDGARRLHEAAWPDMFANLQSAYAELTNAQFELERRTSEIAETRDLFQQVVSSMTEALFLTDRSGRVIRANPAAAALLECPETSILGRPLTTVCGSDEIPATPWKLMELAPTGRLTNLEIDVYTIGGAAIPVSFSLGLMHDKQNKITGVLAVARDMREHSSLINSLVAARTRFQELLEFAPDAIILANQEGRIVLVNSQTEKLFGYRRDELLGQSAEILLPERAQGQSGALAIIRQDSPLDLEDYYYDQTTGVSEQFEFNLADRNGREFEAEITRRRIDTEDGILIMSLIRDITERRRIAVALDESEERYRNVTETASDVIMTVGDDGHVKFVNSSVQRVFGYRPAEVEGNDLVMLMPEYLRDLHKTGMKSYLETGQKRIPWTGVELTGLHKDGHEFPIELAFNEYVRNGRHAFTGIIRDISERKRVEAARRAAETRYQELFDNANDMIYTCDLEGRFTSMNLTAERITGHQRDEVLKMNIGQIVAPEHLETVRRTMADRVTNGADTAPYEIEIICKDGRRLPIEVNARLIYEDGRPFAIQGIARDISERKREEKAGQRRSRQSALRADISEILADPEITLRQCLQKCAEAVVTHLDAAFARIWLFDERDQTLELQASAGMYTHIDGAHARVPLGKFKVGMIAEEKTPHLTNDIVNDPRVGDQDWARREGLVSFAGYPLVNGDRLIGVIVMFAKHKLENDMINALEVVADKVVHGIERRWVENQRAAFLAREQEARRLAEDASRLKDDFLAMISHELRAPLTAILGWAQMLRSGALDRASAERALLTIERNAKSQAHLVGDLLDASRIATGKLSLENRPVELMSIVEAAVDAVRPSVEAKSLRMQIVLEPWVGPFNGDAERLKQVVWNLLSNAIKFTPQGGLIEVRLERLENKALLIVSDTGQGIDPEFLPHIFDRFSQVDSTMKRRQGGLGLGLAIVKHIVELHGGAIYAYSRGEGQGSDFMITLPLAKQESAAEGSSLWATRPEGEETRSGTLRGVRVLVVDDEHDTREVLSVMLSRYGTEVRTAASAAEALQVFRQWKPDVLVSDIGMPEEDGYALIEKIRALPQEDGADTPAIALTAFAAAQDKERAIASGFQRHLAKPIEPVALAKNVARILGRSDEGITL
ncbi:MAG TPA: PAS domain S-box protein [Blastocatellia bacterium]|nr:PAS domain S-box protein [Blastocatellia bacterium]